MGLPKRKWESMDSAIADMSSEESFSPSPETEASHHCVAISQQESPASSHQSKRRRGSFTAPLGFRLWDFGTAASQRPRRETAPQRSPPIVTPQASPQHRKNGRRVSTDNILTAAPSNVLHDEVISQLSTHEVNGNDKESEQTPERNQAIVELSTPPQTVEKTNTLDTPQCSLRRSTRKSRPTERSQHALIDQITPCKKKIKASSGCASSDTSTTQTRKSYIVRLRVPSISHQTSDKSMSFTGSFSHRQKSDSYDSQAFRERVRCAMLNQDQSTNIRGRIKI